jgi:hypothetical protein
MSYIIPADVDAGLLTSVTSPKIFLFVSHFKVPGMFPFLIREKVRTLQAASKAKCLWNWVPSVARSEE